jgi:hypothetical protein
MSIPSAKELLTILENNEKQNDKKIMEEVIKVLSNGIITSTFCKIDGEENWVILPEQLTKI